MYDSSKMQDVAAPEGLEIEIRADGSVVWIHIDGVTALRVCRVKNLIITDHRTDTEELAEYLKKDTTMTQEERVEFRKNWDAKVKKGFQ